ncbi:MAG: right-handed parallel beta-helix repeat-containing protein [Nitrospiraceae bacterium]|nr:right-handed parallel beta-helix repeat-containing protein [Nitrospiraceae bacterium]
MKGVFTQRALAAALSMLLGLCAATSVHAADLIVPTGYAKIQAAIDAAEFGDRVIVEPGTYQEAIVLKDGIELLGRETARTLLSGGGSGPIISASGSVSSPISNFTFINASVGIQVSNDASGLAITNNVFDIGATPGSFAIVIQASPKTQILNNTFASNGTAISRDADIDIRNNIFANSQTVAIGGQAAASAKVSYNLFFNNVLTGPTGTNFLTGDPQFVDPGKRDFHLLDVSPCIDAGDPLLDPDSIDNTASDIGAYGGQYADPTPFPVSGLAVASITDTSIELVWSPNMSYLNTFGSYRLYYGYAPGQYNGTDAEGGGAPSPIEVGIDTTFTLLDLNPLARTPSAPVLDDPVAGDTTLNVSWKPVAGAAGYTLHYGASSPGEHSLDVGNVLSYALTGLTNGQSYRIAVTSYAPANYYIAVTALDSTPDMHESAKSAEVVTQIGPLLESGLSNIKTEYPDAAAGYPILADTRGKCFIATAAYGQDAPAVRTLRVFRDRYLVTSGWGRRFVAWYYRNSPAWAAYLNDNPVLKPLVRVALAPLVILAAILTESTSAAAAGTALIAGATVFLSRKKRDARKGSRP